MNLQPGQKWYLTELRAICAVDGYLKTFVGPKVPGISFWDAENYCQMNGLGYCKVTGELISEQSFDGSSRIDYDTPNLN